MNQLIKDFYAACKNLDAEAMVACYHKDIIFEDPAFGILKGTDAKNMWRMLCKNAVDLQIEFSNIKVDTDKATANWEAQYTFRTTGRKVHNKIQARFKFKDGKIIQHIDVFNLHNWAKQALGIKGYLLGGTTFFKTKLNQQTNSLLQNFKM